MKGDIDKPKVDDLDILKTKPGKVEEKESEKTEEDIPQQDAEAPAEELVFSKALDPNERKHFQMVSRIQKDNIFKLRTQVQALVAHINTLPETEESKKLLESLSTL